MYRCFYLIFFFLFVIQAAGVMVSILASPLTMVLTVALHCSALGILPSAWAPALWVTNEANQRIGNAVPLCLAAAIGASKKHSMVATYLRCIVLV